MTAIHPHAEQILRAAALMESRAAAATAGPWLPSTVWSPRSSVTSGVYSHAHPAGSAATQVETGLYVYQLPTNVAVGQPNRWSLGLGYGVAIADFPTEEDATRAASDIAAIADWTADIDELRAVGLRHGSRHFRQLLWDGITRHGGAINHMGTRPA